MTLDIFYTQSFEEKTGKNHFIKDCIFNVIFKVFVRKLQ